jgi:hypothetical protein
MRLRHAHYARAAGVLRDPSVSRSVRHAGDRGASLSFNPAVNAPPVKAAVRLIRTLSAGFVMAAAGHMPGKHRKVVRR